MYKGNLTKQEAYDLMMKGHKVWREGFSSEEYLYMDRVGKIKSEEGYNFAEWWNQIEPTMHKTDDKTFYLFNK